MKHTRGWLGHPRATQIRFAPRNRRRPLFFLYFQLANSGQPCQKESSHHPGGLIIGQSYLFKGEVCVDRGTQAEIVLLHKAAFALALTLCLHYCIGDQHLFAMSVSGGTLSDG